MMSVVRVLKLPFVRLRAFSPILYCEGVLNVRHLFHTYKVRGLVICLLCPVYIVNLVMVHYHDYFLMDLTV